MIEDDLEVLSVLDILPRKISTRPLVHAYLSPQKIVDVDYMLLYSSWHISILTLT